MVVVMILEKRLEEDIQREGDDTNCDNRLEENRRE
jgi:hypothetical protein